MKTQTLNTIAVILMTSWQTMKAQTFNTISDARPRYKVEQPTVQIAKEASPESDTSTVHVPLTKDTSHTKTEQTRYPLSVSYPLRQSKLHISSPYGTRMHPILKVRKFHNGVDLRAKREPVYAMLPGKVVKTGYDNVSGNFITLQHGPMSVTFCHLSVIGIEKGAVVYAGQPLGICGSTGRSTGVHLHLTLKINGEICNPMLLLDHIIKQTKTIR